MAEKPLTIVTAYQELDRILNQFRNGDIYASEAFELITELNEQAQVDDVPFKLEITEEQLTETNIGVQPSDYSSYLCLLSAQLRQPEYSISVELRRMSISSVQQKR